MTTVDPRALPNINALWCWLLVDELVRGGVRHFVVAPGSRSTPLVIAAVRNPEARVFVCRDERGAAFAALGVARATGVPAAVITTSGTAVANLAPAVVEAAADPTPLLLLTADRPPELHDCGANQTTRQTGLFGDHLRWSLDLPAPSDTVAARYVVSAAATALGRAREQRGPVQLNCRLREPLAPVQEAWNQDCLAGLEDWLTDRQPLTACYPTDRPAALPIDDTLADLLNPRRRGLVVAGGGAGPRDAVLDLARALGWPVRADIRSGLRLGPSDPLLLPHAELCFGADCAQPPEIVLLLGDRPTATALGRLLESSGAALVVVGEQPVRVDPGHRARAWVRAEPGPWAEATAAALLGGGAPRADHVPATWRQADAAVGAALDDTLERSPLAEPWIARWLSAHLPPRSCLFAANSLAIRVLDQYGVRGGPELRIASNRGVSGIDGLLATAVGFAHATGERTTLLIGDQALIHDLNSLVLLRELAPKMLVVLLNNFGGGIFHQLPIAACDGVLTPYFDGGHGFGFGGVCADFDLAYRAVDDRAAFGEAVRAALKSDSPAVIEARIDAGSSAALQQSLQRLAADAATGARR